MKKIDATNAEAKTKTHAVLLEHGDVIRDHTSQFDGRPWGIYDALLARANVATMHTFADAIGDAMSAIVGADADADEDGR